MTASAPIQDRRAHRIAVIYDTGVRPDTMGEHCRRALEEMGITISHFLPKEVQEIPRIYDLYLRVDDDLDYALPAELHPLAYWAIDTHRGYLGRLPHARAADFVFCAQQNGAGRMRRDGIRAHWLPCACDPRMHRRIPGAVKEHDIAFVGHATPANAARYDVLQSIRRRYPRAFVGQAYGDDMARVYSASRLTFNWSLADDVNMRVFEATACGSLLLTNDLTENGQDLLFTPGTHLVTYRDLEELWPLIDRYLRDEATRERMAEAGMRHAHARHTYRQRMTDLLRVVFEGMSLDASYPIADHEPRAASREGTAGERAGARAWGRGMSPESPDPGSRSFAARPAVSIIIPTFNKLGLTQQCVASIREYTDIPHELLIVDNGSSDGTAAWARAEGLGVIANEENLGFPRACNQGMLAADGAYLLLLNNDTVVSPGWLELLVAHAEGDPTAGLVGPSTNFAVSCQKVPARYASRDEFLTFAAQLSRTEAGAAVPVTRLVGLCLLIPRRVVQAVGLLDERFGLGNFEDDDYCLRVRMAGFRLLWAKDVFIHHEGHQSFRELGEGFQRILDTNERLFREKWDLTRYFGSGNGQPPEASAWDLLRGGRYAEAYDAFERLARVQPRDARALVGLGLAAEGRGVPAAAALAYRAALVVDPQAAGAARGLARTTGEVEEFLESVEWVGPNHRGEGGR